MAGIFINYRRDDAPGVAGRLGDRLSKKFSNREIFMDVDAMQPGLDFVKQLDEQVSKCDAFLAVIGPNWLSAEDEEGRRKLDLPRDYVRVELAAALKRDIPVIPLLVNGTAMPREDALPEDIKSLAHRHALELRHSRFAADSEAVVEALERVLPKRARWRWVAAIAVGLAACVLGGVVWWSMMDRHRALAPTEKQATSQQSRIEAPNTAPVPPSVAASIQASAPTQTKATDDPNGPPVPVFAKRVALVIGNSDYVAVPRLLNPSRDATSMAQLLKDSGFDFVDLRLNVTNLEFRRAIRKFELVAAKAEMAMIYYAGHGLQIGGTNFLVPVDAKLATDVDADDEAVTLDRLVSSVDAASRLRLLILDACRESPFVTTMRRQRRTGAISSGLYRVEPTRSDTLITYAAKAGSTAEDGDGLHSPYATALLKNLAVPGLDIRLAFGRIRDEVMKSTGNRQEPFIYGSLGSGTVSLFPLPSSLPDDIKADFELVAKLNTVPAWRVFLSQHPTGFYADLARAALARLSDQPDKGR